MTEQAKVKEETPAAAAQFNAGAALDRAYREYKKLPTVQNEEALLKAAQGYRGDFLKAFTAGIK